MQTGGHRPRRGGKTGPQAAGELRFLQHWAQPLYSRPNRPGTRPSSCPPSHKALRQPPTSHQPGELLPALEHPGPAMSAPSACHHPLPPHEQPQPDTSQGPMGSRRDCAIRLTICGSLSPPQHQSREAPPPPGAHGPAGDLNLRGLSLHSVTGTPDTYPASLLPPPQVHVKNKTRNRASAPGEAGPVPRPCPRTQISSWLEVGRARRAVSKI